MRLLVSVIGCSLFLVCPEAFAAERKPVAVSGLSAKATADGVKVAWRVPRGAKWRRVIVEQRASGNKRWSLAASRPVRTPSALIRGLAPGVTHRIRVRARTARGLGPARTVSIVPLLVPAGKEHDPPAEPVVPSGTLPLLTINTDNAAPIVDKENYIDGTWSLDPLATDFEALSGNLEIRGRGNMTWLAPKKPYRIKLAKKAPLLGMKSNRHFALLADFYDRTSMKNGLAKFFSEFSTLEWTPAVEHVEVVLNGDYIGLYTLVETVRVDDDRVQDELLFEVDWRWEKEGTPQGWWTTAGVGVVLKEPEEAEADEFEEAEELVQDFEDALMGEDFTEPDIGYRQHINVNSWVDWILIEELMLNADAFLSSTYLSAGEDGKLRLGPMWDHDLTFGEGSGLGPENRWIGTKVWHVWAERLLEDPWFADRLRDRWDELRPMIGAAQLHIAELAPYLAAAAGQSFMRWDPVGPGVGFAEAVANLSNYLDARAEYLDTAL